MRVSSLFCTVEWFLTCKLRVPIKSENKTFQSVIRNSVRTTKEEMTQQGNPQPLGQVPPGELSLQGPAAPPPGPEDPPPDPPRSPALPLPSSRTPTGRAGGGVRPGPAHSASPQGSAQSRQDRFTAGGEGGP